MGDNVEKWQEKDGLELFREVGLSRGQIVLDFGCGAGNYTIPAAVIVGMEGRVYALDKERWGFWPSEGLDKLVHKLESLWLKNIVVMKTSGKLKIGLEDESVDVVLLYDVLHYYYFPETEDRKRLLREIHRVLKPGGFISFYAGDAEVSGHYSELEAIKSEIRDTGFHLEREFMGTVIHENVIQKGHVLEFRKGKQP